MTDIEIVALAGQAIQGDADAFDELCRRKTRSVLFNAYAVLGSMDEAEEVAQESFIDMFRHIGQLKSPEAFDVWLLRIDQNNARRFLSKRLHRNEDLNDDEWEKDLPEVNEDLLPEKNFEKIQISGQLMSTIMSLSIRQREAVVLYYYEGLSYAEIADLMGTTIQTVSTNLLKAKRRIKSELEARAGGGVWS